MQIIDFEKYWNSHFPTCPPVGHLLRQNFPELWFRIHTLPESKRYPETESEYQEILRRHNTILSDLFDDKFVYLLLTGYSSSKQPVKPKYRHGKVIQIQVTYILSIPMHLIVQDDQECYWHIWASVLEWKDRAIDDLLRKVADDRIRNMLLVETKSHQIYHPYDGGADIILASKDKKATYKAKYKDWLSKHPKGL